MPEYRFDVVRHLLRGTDTITMNDESFAAIMARKPSTWIERAWWRVETPVLVTLAITACIAALGAGTFAIVFAVRAAWTIGGAL